jgi:magnesium-transporting ATPase (P-type)
MFMAEAKIRPGASSQPRTGATDAGQPPAVSPAELSHGLSAHEADQLLAYFGPNDIPSDKEHGLFRIILDVMQEPMFLLLTAAALIYATLGEKAKSLLVASFAALTIVLVIIQQNRSEKALQALQSLAAPTARVMRDGREQRIGARDLVPGDILLIGEGERIAADALLKEGQALEVDESVLTGEAVPVRKLPEKLASDVERRMPGGDDQPHLYSGTLAVAGHGIAEVQFTGGATQTGDIGKSLASIKSDDTIIQQSVTKLVRIFGFFAIIVSSVLVLFYGLTRGDWLQGALAGIALAIAMLPEEFPVVLAIFLALGALRLSRIGVLARRSSAIEALGAATVLCVDKTGTLTKNEMRLRWVTDEDQQFDLTNAAAPPGGPRATLKFAVMASRARSVDPLDRAVHACAGLANDVAQGDRQLVCEFGLTPELLAMTSDWRVAKERHVIAAKGAPEAILSLCAIADRERATIETEVARLASKGWRVLAIASAEHLGASLPESPRGFAFRYQGLIAFEDPLRESVPAAVKEAKAAGIAVAMIHLPLAGVALLPVLLGFPPIMLPVHVVLTEMIVDPVCSLAFENEGEEPDIMTRPPRNAADAIAGLPQIMLGLIQGSVLLSATLAVYWFSLKSGSNDGAARALAFITLTAGNLMLVRVNGAQGLTISRLFAKGHLSFWIIACLGAFAIWAAITFPVLRSSLKFDVPDAAAVAAAAATGAVSVLLLDLWKLLPPVRKALGAARA